MTTLVEDLQTLLSPLAAGGSWYAVNETEPPVYPYITFQRIVSTTNNSLQGASNLQNTRVQVDVYARRMADAVALQLAIEAAFAAWAVQNVELDTQDFYEPEVKAYRLSTDFSVWAVN